MTEDAVDKLGDVIEQIADKVAEKTVDELPAASSGIGIWETDALGAERRDA